MSCPHRGPQQNAEQASTKLESPEESPLMLVERGRLSHHVARCIDDRDHGAGGSHRIDSSPRQAMASADVSGAGDRMAWADERRLLCRRRSCSEPLSQDFRGKPRWACRCCPWRQSLCRSHRAAMCIVRTSVLTGPCSSWSADGYRGSCRSHRRLLAVFESSRGCCSAG